MQEKTYQEGDLVYQINSATQIGHSRKLRPVWKGPFLVTKVISPALYKVRGRRDESVVHHDRLKICQDRHIPMWMRRLRHQQLSLNETIGYDKAEDDPEEVPTLAPLFQPPPTGDTEELATEPEDLPPPDDSGAGIPEMSLISNEDEVQDTEVVEQSAASHEEIAPRVSRRGRVVRTPAHLRDYTV